jgi:hypothetical protein
MRIVITQRHGYTSKDGREFPFGMEADLADDLAAKLIHYRIAAPAPPKPKRVETVAVKPTETAAKRTGKAPKRSVAKPKEGRE